MRLHSTDILKTVPGVDASPVALSLSGGGRVVIHRPSLRDYMRYEAEWTGLIGAFLPLFRGVGFLTAEEMLDSSLSSRFVREIMRAVQDKRFLKCLRWFGKRWTRRWSFLRAVMFRNGWTGIIEWPEGIDYRNFDQKLTYSQVCEVFTLFHNLVVTEKKNTSEVAAEVAAALKGYSISAPLNGGGLQPRYGKPKL
jgi:hypothetical protein